MEHREMIFLSGGDLEETAEDGRRPEQELRRGRGGTHLWQKATWWLC
jgi:hypothetical protein